MVYIHGGGFGWGGTADPLYNGETIVEQHDDVIVVSMNYRLGMFGEILPEIMSIPSDSTP